MNKDTIWQLVRQALLAGGAALATKYGMDAAQVGSAIDLTYAAVMASVAAGSAIWGLYVKWNTRAVPNATAMRHDVPTINAATGQTEPGTAYTK
jgi:hypothetical protein